MAKKSQPSSIIRPRAEDKAADLQDLSILIDQNGSSAIAESKFRGFIENLPVMFYAVEPESPYKPIYISPNFEKFGYSHSEWMTNPQMWVKVIHEQDRDRVLENTATAMRASDGIDYEYRVIGRDGTLFWVRDRSCFIRDKSGKPICWQGVILDITERHLAVDELQKRENLYRRLARTIPRTAVLLFDHDHRYTLADGEQLKNHEWPQEMFEGRTLSEVFPPDVADEWAGYYERALGGEEVVIETDNDDGAMKIHVLPVKDEDGKIFAGMVMWQDVTETRRAENALRESETRYRQLFENASDIIYVHDLEGNYISINEVATRVLGYSMEEALSMNITDIAAPEHLERTRANLAKKLDGTKNQTVYEVDCIKKDGSRATFEVNSSVVTSGGAPIAIQGIARDITERKQAEESVRKSEERYRDLFENANDLIYTHDLAGNFTSLNRAGEKITGFSRDEALNMNLAQVVAPDFLEAARTMIAKKVTGDTPTTYELEIIAKDGQRVILELSTRLMVSDGLPVGVQGIGRDITARREAEKSLRNTLSLFETTFESTADGIVVMSLDREIVTCNRKFVEMWSVDEKIIESKDGTALVRHVANQLKHTHEFLRQLDEVYKDSDAIAAEILELRDGRIFERYSQPQRLNGRAIGRVACFRDITTRTQAEEKLRHYALHDTLTNLPNRIAFMDHLRIAVERADGNDHAQFAVLFLDLDRFKVINDSLGHATGDKLLIALAERLKSCVRPGDVVARLGGDEFTILLNRSGGLTEVVGVADRLQSRISETFKIDNYEVFTTASIGIIVSSDVKRAPEDFLRDADAAMYRAKESGKARYEVFDRQMHVRNMNLLQVETDLRHAVERNEFEVLYQPIVNLETGSIREFEALIRWHHPNHGLVGPNEFISVAEETGLIIPIGKWIIEESCRQVVKWQKKFTFDLAVSVNLSAKQLMHPRLTKQVAAILKETGLNPSQLKLEVTETNVMEHAEKALMVLKDLEALGISLSTDDFGTGYSSLSYLQRFPFDRLKIDRSFIIKMDIDEKSTAIVKTILMLGENLGIDIVAEGIETEEQMATLRSLGCRHGQGYLFSRPVSAKGVEKLLRDAIKQSGSRRKGHIHPNSPLIDVSDRSTAN